MRLSPEVVEAAQRAALKASPAGAVVIWNNISSIPAEKWLTYATLVYVVLQAFVLARKEFFKRREGGQ